MSRSEAEIAEHALTLFKKAVGRVGLDDTMTPQSVLDLVEQTRMEAEGSSGSRASLSSDLYGSRQK
ncbi:MAG: hypothetical protein ACR2J4_03625 [Deinococcus sp.]